MGARGQWQRCEFLVHYALTCRGPIRAQASACTMDATQLSPGVVNSSLATTLLTSRTRSVAVLSLALVQLPQKRKRPALDECGALNWNTKRVLLLGLIHVIANDSAEYGSGSATDDRALHFVSAGDRANNRTRAGADRGVTLGVLDYHGSGSRSAVNRRR